MKKYRSLIYRELKISRTHLIETSALFLLFIAMILFIIFAQSGSSSDTPPEAVKGSAFYLCFTLSILTPAIICLDNTVLEADSRTGWARYSLVLPVTAWEKAVTGYIIKAVMMAAGAIICLITALIIDHRLDISVSGCNMNIFFTVLDLGLLFDAVHCTFVFLSRDEKKSKAFKTTFFIIGVCAFLCALKFFPLKELAAVLEEADMNKMIEFFHVPEKFSPVLVILLILSFAVSFIITWKNMERREA